jgi:hypothetical protein
MDKILLPAMTVAHLLITEANIDGGLCPYDIRKGEMALSLPHSYSRTLCMRDDAGRTQFFEQGQLSNWNAFYTTASAF